MNNAGGGDACGICNGGGLELQDISRCFMCCGTTLLIWIVTRLGILISEEAKRDAKREKLINILNLK